MSEELTEKEKLELAERARIEAEALDWVTISISKILIYFPLFYVPLVNLKKVVRWDLPTMAVGPINKYDLGLFINPKFVLTLTSRELMAVLQHEAMHILLQHITRGVQFAKHNKLWNYAADYTINPRIPNIPSWGLFPEQKGYEDGESAEYYYSLLKEERDKFLEELKEKLSDAEIDERFLDSVGGQLIDDHSLWGDMTEEERNVISEKIRNLADEAVRAQSKVGYGNLPGSLIDEIMAANKPKVNWKRELRYFIGRLVSIGRKSTRSRPNRRYGYDQPGKKRKYTSRVLVAFDTSGSVDDSELQMFGDELPGMVGKVAIDFVCFDTQIQGEPKEIKRRNDILRIKGRGGTDFAPVIELADKLKYDGLIIMTDGECYFPPPPKCKMMWVLSRDSKWAEPPPYGKVIRLNEI